MTSIAQSTHGQLEGVPAPGEIVADKYQVEEIVGVGGMGVVVAARHVQLGQRVAIKILRAGATNRAEATARFLREGRAAAGLVSDHVVRVHDVGTLPDGTAFMVMELLRGVDLAAHLATVGALPVPLAVDFVLQICSAIAEAHAAGIVHRDLKPSNLFLTRRSDGSPLLKVLDFGISKARDDGEGGSFQASLTSTRSVIGSPAYMAPEQIRDAKHVDHRADIWALGLILYELLSGHQAFKADTLPAVCAAIVADLPKPLHEHRASLPPAVIAVVERCLEKDPQRRFQSVNGLADALAPYGSRQLDLTCDPTTTSPLAPHPLVVDPAGATVLSGVTATATSAASSPAGLLWAYGRSRRVLASVVGGAVLALGLAAWWAPRFLAAPPVSSAAPGAPSAPAVLAGEPSAVPTPPIEITPADSAQPTGVGSAVASAAPRAPRAPTVGRPLPRSVPTSTPAPSGVRASASSDIRLQR